MQVLTAVEVEQVDLELVLGWLLPQGILIPLQWVVEAVAVPVPLRGLTELAEVILQLPVRQ